MNSSIDKQYKAFHDGFYRVCGGIVLKLFQPMELMDLVTGNENYSWKELEKNTEYKVLTRDRERERESECLYRCVCFILI